MKVLTLALLFSLPATPWSPQKPSAATIQPDRKTRQRWTLVLCRVRPRRLLLRPSDDLAAR